MPRPPRKKIPFQPAGTRVNIPADAAAQTSSKLKSKTTRPGKAASRDATGSKKLPPETREDVVVDETSNGVSVAAETKKQSRANARRPRTSSLRRQSTSRIASSISPEESLVQEPAHPHDSLALDTSAIESSQLVERVNDSFTTAPIAIPLSRRPSMSRPPTVPPSAMKPQATPSFLGNFKRRARQPSILRMVQQQSEAGSPSSSVEGDTTYFSLDRSVVTPAPSSNTRKRKRSSAAQADTRQTASEAGNLPSDPAELPVATSPSYPNDDVQIPATAQNDDSEQEDAHDEPSLPLHLEQDLSPTPTSSPPSSDLAAAFTAQRRRARRATAQRSALSKPAFARAEKTPPVPTAQPSSPPMSPATSPLSLSSSSPTKPHNQQTREAGNKRQKRSDGAAKPLRTADLQTLLPQRRTLNGRRTRSRYADEFEIAESSSVRAASEDDEPEPTSSSEIEVSVPSARGGRLRRTGAVSAPKRSGTKKAGRQKSGPAPLARKGSTYSRRASELAYEDQDGANDEVEAEEDETVDEGGAGGRKDTHALDMLKASAELQAAAQKFKEVDEWELSFESCDVNGAGDSSPWR